jgi:protoporphyrinogen/coproporphyrinogen III oxidase
VYGMREQLRGFDADQLLALADRDDPARTAEDVAVAAFGREAAEYLIDPLMRTLGGSRMGTVSTLIVPYALSGWSQALITLRGGLDRLPRALAAVLDVRYRTRVQQVVSNDSGVTVACVDTAGASERITADKCLITAQYDDAVRLYPRFAALDPEYGSRLKFARLLDVKLAYGKPTRSRACVAQVPTVENPELLMFSLSHNKAPDRAPAGNSLFTVYSEHAIYDRLAALDEPAVIAWARQHIEALYPELVGSFRFGLALQQPRTVCFSDPGYYRRTRALWERIGAEPHVHLGGDMMNGGSMEAACVGGERAAERLLATSNSHAPAITTTVRTKDVVH